MKTYQFTQPDGKTYLVTINPKSKRNFGSFGFMWIVTFVDCFYEGRQTAHYMDAKHILECTGVDVTKRNWQYK